MSDLSKLAAQYIIQLESEKYVAAQVRTAKQWHTQSLEKLQELETQLKAAVDLAEPKVLIQADTNSYVLVHNTRGAFGIYTEIDVLKVTS
jgi:hypothetical protein